MHAAPSVTYPVGRSAFAGWLSALAVLAGLAAALAWSAQADAFGWRQALALAAVAASAAFCFAAWQRSPTGALRWDGAGWALEQGGARAAGHPETALDLQNRMLLRWHADGGRTRWLWLERTSAPADWDALRRAVYSRASAPVQPAGEPPAAEQ